jgi:hypothetical protein
LDDVVVEVMQMDGESEAFHESSQVNQNPCEYVFVVMVNCHLTIPLTPPPAIGTGASRTVSKFTYLNFLTSSEVDLLSL